MLKQQANEDLHCIHQHPEKNIAVCNEAVWHNDLALLIDIGQS